VGRIGTRRKRQGLVFWLLAEKNKAKKDRDTEKRSQDRAVEREKNSTSKGSTLKGSVKKVEPGRGRHEEGQSKRIRFGSEANWVKRKTVWARQTL